MKNKPPMAVLIVIVLILGVLNIFLLKNNQKANTPIPTQVPSPTSFVAVPMLTDPSLATSEGKQMVGNDKDVHGCIGSAGYTWCEVKNRCLRVWEEKCEEEKGTDSELIKTALYEKNKWPLSMPLTIDISENTGIYASGSASGAEGGGYFYAKKVGSEWKIVVDGNGMIMCDVLKDYPDYPNTMIPSCYDSIKGESIAR